MLPPLLLLAASACAAIVLQHQPVQAYDPQPAEFWWLNTFLDHKTLGRYEAEDDNGFRGIGPCPSYGDECNVNFATLPPSVKGMGLSLPAPFNVGASIGEVIPQGNLRIFKVELANVEFSSIEIGGEQSLDKTSQSFNVKLGGFKTDLKMALSLSGIKIGSIPMFTIDLYVFANKVTQTDGTSVDMDIVFLAPEGKTLENSFPNNSTLGDCTMSVDLGLEVEISGAIPFGTTVDAIAALVVDTAQPLLGNAVCQAAKQFFINHEGEDGVVQAAVQYAYENLGDVAGRPSPDIDDEERVMVDSVLPVSKRLDAFNFGESRIMRGLSTVANNWLGDGGPTDPAINEVVEQLTTPDLGEAHFYNLGNTGLNFSVATPPFYVGLEVINVTLKGLNTFGGAHGLQLLLNGYEEPGSSAPTTKRNFTLDNKLSLENLDVEFAARVTLTNHYGYTSEKKDGWLYRPRTTGPETTSFIMYYSLGLRDLDVRAVVSIMTNPSEISHLQLGQLLGKSGTAATILGQLADGAKCASPSMYGFALPFLTLKTSNIVTPVFTLRPEDAGVSNLVNDATTQGLLLLKSVVTNNLEDIANHWIRPTANDLIRDALVAGDEPAECPQYVTQGKTTANFLQSRLFDTVKTLVRDVIGGSPVPNNKVSINALLDQLVSFGCAALSTTNPCEFISAGKWKIDTPGLKLRPTHSFTEPAGLGEGSITTNELAITGIALSGINSVTKLLIDNLPNRPQGVMLNFTMGSAANPLTVDLLSRWRANYKASASPSRLDVDETFTLRVLIEGLNLNAALDPDYDLDQLYQLAVHDLTNTACLVAPLASLDLVHLDLSFSNFAITARDLSSAGVAGNKLKEALDDLTLESHAHLVYMLNYLVRNLVQHAKSIVGRVNNNDGTSFYTCHDKVSAFDTVFNRVARHLLNSDLQEMFDKGFGAQPAPPTPAEMDTAALAAAPFGFVAYDLEESTIASLPNRAVRGLTSADFRQMLHDTAAGSGDLLSDSLIAPSGPTGPVNLDLNVTALLPNGFSLEALVPGGKLLITRLQVTSITNLDIDQMVLLNPISKYATATRIVAPGTMKVKLTSQLTLPNALKSATGTGFTTTEMNLDLDLVDLDIDLQAVTALSFSKISTFSIGNFIRVDEDQTFSLNPDMWGCLFGLSYNGGLHFPKLIIGLSSLGDLKFTVDNYFLFSAGTVQFVNSALELFNDFYVKDIKDITQGALRYLINDFFLVPNLAANRACPAPERPQLFGTDRILDFERSSTMKFVNKILANTLAGANGEYSVVNSLINGALSNHVWLDSAYDRQFGIQDMAIVYHKEIFGYFRAYVASIQANNFGSIRRLDILRPTSNSSFYNVIEIAGPIELEGEVSFTFTDVWDDGTPSRTNNLFLNVVLTNLTIEFELNMEVDLVDLMVVRANTLTQLSQLSCVATAFNKLQIYTPSFDVGDIQATLSCINCENSMLKPLNNGGELSTGDSDVLTNLLPDAIQFAEHYLESWFFNKQVDDGLQNADKECAKSLNLTAAYPVFNAPAHDHLNVTVIMALGLLGFAVGIFVLAPLAIPRHYQLKDRMLAEQLQAANKEPGANAQSIARYMAKQERLNIAMAFHPSIPMCCKCFVPVMALINVLLLALSFLIYLAFSIDARVIIAGDPTKIYTLVPWTVASTINDFWNSGAWPLGVLVILLSCAWPVAKNLALIIIWYAPRTYITPAVRMRMLVILDILGKWSFLDVYIIVVLVAGLRFSLSVGASPYIGQVVTLPMTVLQVDCIVTPGVGVVILCVAAFMSLVVNHVIIYLLDNMEWVDHRLFKQIDGVKEDDMLTDKPLVRLAICDYVFSTTAPNGERDRFRPAYKYGLVYGSIASAVVLVIGMASPYFYFEYKGLIGYVLLFLLETGRKRPFSLLSLVTEMGKAGENSTFYGVLFAFFQILYLATVIVTPFIQLALQSWVWLRPMSLKSAKRGLFFSKVAAYWASLEVFAVAIVATSIEIGPVAAFLLDSITGGGCSALVAPLSDVLGADQGSCMYSFVVLEWGFFICVIANLMYVGIGSIYIRAIAVAIRDREDVLEHQPHRVWTMMEYRVMNYLFVHGAEHHKPPQGPPKKRCQCAVECAENPMSCFSLKSCCSCFKGLGDVSLMSDTAGKKVGGGASKWNAAPVPQSSQWNNAGGPQSQSMNFGGGVQNSAQWTNNGNGAHGSQIVSSNPVYSMESRKPMYSVDV